MPKAKKAPQPTVLCETDGNPVTEVLEWRIKNWSGLPAAFDDETRSEDMQARADHRWCVRLYARTWTWGWVWA